MAETIRERILGDIKSTLEGLTTANGYNFTFLSSDIQRWSMHGNSKVNLPAIMITAGDESQVPVGSSHEDCAFRVYLDAFFTHNKDDAVDTDTYLNRLQGDIKKIIMEDYTRSGLAIDTSVTGSTPFETADGQVAGVTVELEIKYRHLRNDPTATG